MDINEEQDHPNSDPPLKDDAAIDATFDRDSRIKQRVEMRRNSFIGKYAGRLMLALLIAVVVVVGLGWFVFRSAQTPPEFYHEALLLPPDELDAAGKEFESRVFELQNAMHEPGEWQTEISAEQINGWLASDLPEKFPDALPNGISNPRIAINDDEAKLGFQITSRRFTGFIVCEADIFATDIPNEIAVRIMSAKSGIVPLPISRWADNFSASMRMSGAEVSWTELDGDPVALVKLPHSMTESEAKSLRIENVRLAGGSLILHGETVEAAEEE